ncbi:MAG: VRR-NUC domain-containing protein [Gammaproteobacteria bacterium]|nr:VRR-NUC domain-containing protein [Gammaproteobacteria bacterium]
MSEHDHQVAVIQWFRAKYPKHKWCIFSNPNGAILCDLIPKKRVARMRYLMAEGFKKGVSDLFIAVPVGDKHGLWVEMKDVNKTLCSVSKDQMEHIELMTKMGYEAIWCAGSDIAIAAITTYMSQK